MDIGQFNNQYNRKERGSVYGVALLIILLTILISVAIYYIFFKGKEASNKVKDDDIYEGELFER